jgi:tetratricopeptide (TPR) repeat protein
MAEDHPVPPPPEEPPAGAVAADVPPQADAPAAPPVAAPPGDRLVRIRLPLLIPILALLGAAVWFASTEVLARLGFAYPAGRWVTAWAAALAAGLPLGLAVWVLGGLWIRLVAGWNGGRADFRLSRSLWGYAAGPAALAVLAAEAVWMLRYGAAYFTQPVHPEVMVALDAVVAIGLLVTLTLAAGGAAWILSSRPAPTLLLLVVLPLGGAGVGYLAVQSGMRHREVRAAARMQEATAQFGRDETYGAEKSLRLAVDGSGRASRDLQRRACLQLGVLLENRGEKTRAAAWYRRALELADPGGAAAAATRGDLLLLTHRTGEAIQCFRRALELDPDNLAAHNNLGLIYLGLKGDAVADPGRALPHNRACHRLGPCPATAYHLAYNYFRLERWAEARSLFEELWATSADHDDYRYYLGICQFRLGDQRAADRLLTAKDYRIYGQSLTDADRADEAEQILLLALERARPSERPLRMAVLESLAAAAVLKSNPAGAQRYYRQVRDMCPPGSLDRFRIDGELHLLARQPGLALQDFQRCLELDPDSFPAHNHLGALLLGDFDETLADYDRALVHNTRAFALNRCADTGWNLGRNYYALERWPEALALLEEYATAHPRDAEAKYYLGLTCYELGEVKRAQSLLLEAVALDPELRDEYVDEVLLETGAGRDQGKT